MLTFSVTSKIRFYDVYFEQNSMMIVEFFVFCFLFSFLTKKINLNLSNFYELLFKLFNSVMTSSTELLVEEEYWIRRHADPVSYLD